MDNRDDWPADAIFEVENREELINELLKEIKNAKSALLGEAGGGVALTILNRALKKGEE